MDSILDKNVNSFFRPRKIFLRGVRSSVFRAGIPMEGSGGVGHIEADSVLSVRETSSSPMRDMLRSLMESSRNNQPLSVDGVECVDVAFQGMIGNRQRTVSIAKLENLGTNLDVTNEVAIYDDGYPTYESLHKEASQLITEIKHDTE